MTPTQVLIQRALELTAQARVSAKLAEEARLRADEHLHAAQESLVQSKQCLDAAQALERTFAAG